MLLVAGILRAQRVSPLVIPDFKTPPFEVSEEATGAAWPRRPEGTVDYAGALKLREHAALDNGVAALLQVEPVPSGMEEPFAKLRAAVQTASDKPAPDADTLWWSAYSDFLARDRHVAGPALKAAVERLSELERRPWRAAENPDLAAYLETGGPLLDAVAAAVGRRGWSMPAVIGDGRWLGSAQWPLLGPLRAQGEGLCARAALRAGSADFAGFLADAAAVKRLARHLCGPWINGYTDAGRLDLQLDHTIGNLAATGRLTPDQLAQVAKLLDDVGPLPTLAEAVDIGQRWRALDTAALLATGQGALTDSETGDAGHVEHRLVDWNQVNRDINSDIDEELRAIRAPTSKARRTTFDAQRERLQPGLNVLWQGSWRREDGEDEVAYTRRISLALRSRILKDMARLDLLARQAEMEHEMARALVAAALYRAREGRWPATLEALVPTDLKRVPVDVWTDDLPVKYTILAEGVKLSSVGDVHSGVALGAASP